MNVKDTNNTWKENFNICKTAPYLDMVEMVSRVAMFSTISDLQFEVNEEALDLAQVKEFDWFGFVENVKRNNDLVLKVKGIVKLLSKYGKIISYWDIIKGEIQIGVADINQMNNVARINQTKPIAAMFVYQPMRLPTMQGLVLQELRTQNETQRVILAQGFGAKDVKTGEVDGFIPWNIFKFSVPSVLEYYFGNYPSQEQALKTNYGVISAKEFYNADIVDFELNEFILSDCYPVLWLQNLVNGNEGFLNFLKEEPNTDFTTRIGKFNLADVEPSDYVQEQAALFNKRKKFTNTNQYVASMNSYIQRYSKKNEVLNTRKFTITHDSGNDVKVMQTTFDGARHIDYMNHLVQFFFKASGYSWNVEDSAAMRTNEGVQSVNKLSYETTKMKVALMTRQLRDFLSDIAFGLYHQAHFNEPDALEKAMQVKKDFYKVVKLNIVSNLLNDYLKKDDRIIELVNNNLMSQQKGMEMVNEDMTKEEIQEMQENIKEKEKNDFNMLLAEKEAEGEGEQDGGENK